VSDPWAGPADAPALKRWGMLPLVFAAAGAAGGVADALASEAIIGRYGGDAESCAWIGGGIGLGIGAALSLSRRWWIGVPLAPFLGAAGYAMMAIVCNALHGERWFPRTKDLLEDGFLSELAAVAAPVLVLGHLVWLRWTRLRGSLPLSIAFYSWLGAVSGSVFWWDFGKGPVSREFAMGLLNGAIYGLFQLAAMRVARAMASGPGPAEEARTPS